MFYLVLVFSGAIGFVPMTENRQQVLYALFVEGREPAFVSDRSVLPSHFPVLRVAEEFLVRKDLPADSIFMTTGDDGADGQEDLVWFLDQEQLELEIPMQGGKTAAKLPGLTFADAGEQPAQARPIPCPESEEVSLDWLPQMSQLSSTGGEVNPGCLADKPAPGLLSARMKVSNGKVSSTSFGFTKVDLFDFGSLTSSVPITKFSRAVPGAVQVVIEVPGCRAILRARNFDSKDETGVINIEVHDCEKLPEPRMVKLDLMNIPLEDIVSQKRLFLQEPVHEHEKVDKHFEIFYDLLKTPPPRGARPVPKLVASRTTGGEFLLSMCSDSSDSKARTTINFLQGFDNRLQKRSNSALVEKELSALPRVKAFMLTDYIRTKEFRCPGTMYLPPLGIGK